MRAWQTALIALAVLYIIFFALQWIDSGSAIFGHWSTDGRENPAYWLAPLAGFFLAYFAVHYSAEALSSKRVQGFLFPIAWLAGCVLAFYIAVGAYHYNNYLFSPGTTTGTALGAAFAVAGNILASDFTKNPFFLFSLSGIAGWFVHWIVHR